MKNYSVIHDDIKISFDSHETDCISIGIMLDGNLRYKNASNKDEFYFDNSQIGTFYIQNSFGEEYLKKKSIFKSLNIICSRKYFDPLSTLVDKNSNFQMLKQTKATPKTLALAHELYTFQVKDSFDEIYLQSKCLELVYNEFLSIKKESKKNNIHFSTYDKQALEHAYYILETSYKNPPTIEELSKIVHLNEFKLKYGFRHFYGNSIYQTLLSHRMEKAKAILAAKEANVSEVSKEVGYKHVQSFSVAFNKYHGINPKCFLKHY